MVITEFPYIFRNETKSPLDITYASLTADELIECDIIIDGELHDRVYVSPGSSHSWWTYAGGKFLPNQGLLPGQTLKVTAYGNRVALRIEWT